MGYWDWLFGVPSEWSHKTYEAYKEYLYKFYRENIMKEDKVAEMPKHSTIRAVARKCPQVEEVLKGLFKEAFEEKEIELEDGQIYQYENGAYYLLVKGKSNAYFSIKWKLINITERNYCWGGWLIENDIKRGIKERFTPCPHATITVKE